jgi:serine/threonine protein kinase
LFENRTPPIHSMVESIERYAVVKTLGQGGEATVYLVHDPTTKGLVALRVLKEENEALAPQFLRRARAMAELGHPGIVRVLERSQEGEWPVYCVLSYAPHGTLGSKLNDGHFVSLKEAIRLVIQLAEACHFAHQRGVLHGDISPANILFDASDAPLLTDFGGGPIPGDHTGIHPIFSAPEKQAGGADTVAADVYSLGAILSLLIDRSPCRGLLRRQAQKVCRAATSLVPGQRPSSTEELALNLRRVLRHEPLLQPESPTHEHILLLLSRARFVLGRALPGFVALLMIEAALLAFLRHLEAQSEESARRSYRALATEHAEHELDRLRHLSQSAVMAAAAPELVSYLQDQEKEKPRATLQTLYDQAHGRGADSMSVFNWEGTLLLRHPHTGAGEGHNFHFREYYAGLKRLAPEPLTAEESRGKVYVSQAYRGEASCGIESSIVVPILTPGGEAVGLVLLSMQTQHTLDGLGVAHTGTSKGVQFQSALFIERSTDRPGQRSCGQQASPIGRYITVVHPDLFRAEEYPLESHLSDQLKGLVSQAEPGAQLEGWEKAPLLVDTFLDPVTQSEQMGAFAPVGKTGLVVGIFNARSHFDQWRQLPIYVYIWTLLTNISFMLVGLWAGKSSKSS